MFPRLKTRTKESKMEEKILYCYHYCHFYNNLVFINHFSLLCWRMKRRRFYFSHTGTNLQARKGEIIIIKVMCMYYSTIFQIFFYPTIIQPNQPKQKESYLSFSGYYCVCKNAANKTPTIQTELFSSYSKSNNKNKPEKINVSYSFSFLCADYKGIFFISCLLPWAAKIEAGWEDEKKRYATLKILPAMLLLQWLLGVVYWPLLFVYPYSIL